MGTQPGAVVPISLEHVQELVLEKYAVGPSPAVCTSGITLLGKRNFNLPGNKKECFFGNTRSVFPLLNCSSFVGHNGGNPKCCSNLFLAQEKNMENPGNNFPVKYL